ncbi:hypothetical protein, variant [Aphanomyces astaci]|uniref:Cyclic nucleotide-binding domain-containing protein n=1 Tax=Aphanomyces astaci TaxID=112090 RepID=W4FTD0_APHAT|nr:hypothetical protein, variant [Aphanomyces astaci]ETV69918.1 hypothetical protein, variant [Aphanomyces astaci]|eukprot:XP_009840655.1 hypothetical protein, variant [Aphanomyces astaci]
MPSIDRESKCGDDDMDVGNSSDHTSDDGSDSDSASRGPRGSRLTSRRHTVMATPLRLERGWVPPQYPKSASDRADIRRAIRHNCLFSNLDEQAMTVMVDAMQRFHFEHGEVLIHQGDEGDQFFVLASGAADVFIHGQRVGGVEADTTANFCGELALLYDSPRAATVKVTTPDVVAWGVDRVTFKKVLMDTTIKQRKLYEEFVDEVPILSELTKYERCFTNKASRFWKKAAKATTFTLFPTARSRAPSMAKRCRDDWAAAITLERLRS